MVERALPSSSYKFFRHGFFKFLIKIKVEKLNSQRSIVKNGNKILIT